LFIVDKSTFEACVDSPSGIKTRIHLAFRVEARGLTAGLRGVARFPVLFICQILKAGDNELHFNRFLKMNLNTRGERS